MHKLIFYRLLILSFALLAGLVQLYIFRKTKNKLFELSINENIQKVLYVLLIGFLLYINSPHIYFLLFGRPRGPINSTLLYGFLYPFGVWNTASLAIFIILVLHSALRRFKKHFAKLLNSEQKSGLKVQNFDVKSISRRRFLRFTSSAASLGVLSSPVISATYGAVFEKNQLQVEKFKLHFPNLPEPLKGLRIVQVSDIHSSMYTSKEAIEKVVEQANNLEPDLLAVTGDFVSSSKIYIEPCVQAFSVAQAKYGLYGCLGNHDYYVGAHDILNEFRSIGFQMLVNSGATIIIAGTPINILGVDDLWQGRPNLHKALAHVNDDNFNLLLCHQPNYFPKIQTQKIELTLSGHTHGGQIVLNFFGSSLSFSTFFTPYLRGLFEENNSHLYVNRGIGITGPPLRFNSPPEVTLIILD